MKDCSKGRPTFLHMDTDEKIDDNNTFYMIYVEGGTVPAIKHHDMYEAVTEAKRLAKHTGKETFILEAQISYKEKYEFDKKILNNRIVDKKTDWTL